MDLVISYGFPNETAPGSEALCRGLLVLAGGLPGLFEALSTGGGAACRPKSTKVDVTGLTPMSFYASVGSENAVASVDLPTGTTTPFITSAGGTTLNAQHGLGIAPDFNSLFGK